MTWSSPGSRTGRHPGRVREHSDGQGASFVPQLLFAQGETVRVRSGVRSYSFKVGRRPAPTPTRSVSPDTGAAAMRFASRPDLKPLAVTITRSRAGRAPGYVFLGPKGGRAMGPMIVDDRGELVWFRRVTGGKVAMDVRTQTYRGEPVLTWWEGRLFGGGGRGVGMILDERYRTVKRVRMGNGFQADSHELTITPQGTALFNAWDAVDRPEGRVLQSVVQEVDIATGLVLFEWHSAGHIATSESYRPRESPRSAWDYLHLNSVAVDGEGNFILGPFDQRDLPRRAGGRRDLVAAGRKALELPARRRRALRGAARRPAGPRRNTDAVRQRHPESLARAHAQARRPPRDARRTP